MRYLESRNGIYYYRRVVTVNGKKHTKRISLRTRDYLRAQKAALDLFFESESIEPIALHTNSADKQSVIPNHTPYFESEAVQAVSVLPCPKESILEHPTASEVEAHNNIEVVSDDSGNTLSTIIDMYVSEASLNWSIKEKQTQQSLFDSFIKFVGDADIKSLSKQDAVNYKNSLNNSPVTLNKKLYKLQALFEYIHNHYEIPNIFNGLLVKRVKSTNKRTAYKHNEIESLLKFADAIPKSKEWRKHLLYLSIFTGCRANELCQLYKEDVIKVDNVWCISINDNHADKSLKTPQAKRLVPLHTKLLNNGFIEYVKNTPDNKRLFRMLNFRDGGYSKGYAAWFHRSNPIVARNLHELRHTVSTRLKEANVTLQVAAAIMGHSTGNNMTFETYGSGANMPVKLLKESLESAL
ncbi:tyrosine-type recombinase/integrase [Aeromonas sp. 601027]|uniref:tyrosine-type recombinase/integrase n=1 Tax=Aeromonas sp. 601027 TaxID=2712036 RepID=UPI003BA31864